MTSMLELAVWLVAVPLASSTLARVVATEKIGDPLRTFVEIYAPWWGFTYLVNCEVCFGYWTTLFIAGTVLFAFGPVNLALELTEFQEYILTAIFSLSAMRLTTLLSELTEPSPND